MAGSNARRARRLRAGNENAAPADDEAVPGDQSGGGEAPAVRRPLNRTAARRPTAARTAARRPTAAHTAAKQPTAKEPTAKEPAPGRSTPTPNASATQGPGPTAPAAGRAPLVTRIVGAIDKRGDAPDQVASSLRMRGNETTLGYVVAAVMVVVPVVFLTVTTGKGAPPRPATIAPAIGAVLAVAMAASIPLSNRILSAFLAVTSSLATTSSAVPNSVRPLSTVDLLAALGFAVWITLRQSKARNVVLAERRKANQSTRGAGGGAGDRPARGRRGRKAAEAAEPAGPPPSARYTPPKKRS